MRVSSQARPFEFNDAARAAIKAFRSAKPWRGSVAERGDKFAELHRSLCRAYDLETILVRDEIGDPHHTGSSGHSYFDARTNKIVQRGRLSVVTYLFLVSLAAGADRRSGMRAARAMFQHFFPRSFARCVVRRGLLVKVS
ncbi:MAG: hypothetical protein JNK93_12970 [Planctomycetia bacterium]|nr:hypothetical protein [Planctomycetia bacterium]